MHIASFAGIAPVNNPVISVAVVIDNPKGASYYGAAVSAPVFAEVAQQVLEYLGVPHDIEVHAPRTKPLPESNIAEDDAHAQGDVNSLYAAINDLPSDDPLRAEPAQPSVTAQANTQPAMQKDKQPTSEAVHARTQGLQTASDSAAPRPGPAQTATKAVLVSDAHPLKVP